MGFAFIEHNDKIRGIRCLLKPFAAENISYFGVEGYRVSIGGQEKKAGIRAIRLVERFLNEKGVTSVTGAAFDGMYESDGLILSAVMTGRMAGYSCRAVVISGERNVTETVLCTLCPRVRSLSLCGCGWNMEASAEYFYREYGINIESLKILSSEMASESDLIVDCRKERTFPPSGLGKNSRYISLFAEKDKKYMWATKDGAADVDQHSAVLTVRQVQCVLYSKGCGFDKLVKGDIGLGERIKIAENMEISALTSF